MERNGLEVRKAFLNLLWNLEEMNESTRKAYIELREKNFSVTAHKARFGDYENECSLEVFHNCFHSEQISLSEAEANAVIKELSRFFGFDRK